MNVIYIHGEDEQYANFVLDDAVLTIDGLQYNLVSLQKDEQSIIQNISDIKDILKTSTFNCVYLTGFNSKEIYEYLQKSQNSATLF